MPVTPLLILLAGALISVGAYLLLRDDGAHTALPGGNTASKSVNLLGVAAEDPANDGEHDNEVGRATDKDPATYWTTQDYQSFDKPGVGLVVDAGQDYALSSITVVSDTPGFPATIRAGNSSSGQFVDVSGQQEVGSRTTFNVDTGGKDYRYYEVWLQLPDGGRAHINEVTAKT